MKPYLIKKKKRFDTSKYSFAYSSVSSAHTYGNVIAVVANYIKSLFPDNYFKTVQIATKIAYKEFDFRKNSKKEFRMKEKPMLIIRPRIVSDASNLFANNTFKTTRFTDNLLRGNLGDMMSFIDDNDKGIHIKYLLNRMGIEFEVTIICETIMEQINLMTYFNNRVRQDKIFDLSTALESQIPRKIIDLLSNDLGIPVYDENQSTKRFLDYMNSHSGYPVTYKLKNSTKNDEFFRYYNTKIMTTFEGLNIDDGNKKGFVTDTATMTFNCKCEFWGTGLYYYFTQKVINDIDDDLKPKDPSGTVIPLFTIDLSLKDPGLPESYQLYNTAIFKTDEEMDGEESDVIDISPIMDEDLLDLIKYCQFSGTSIDPYVAIYVSKDKNFIKLEDEFSYDIMKNEVTIFNPDSSVTYRIFIYKNNLLVNELIKKTMNEREWDINKISEDGNNSNYLESRLAPHFGITENAVVNEERQVIPDVPKYPIEENSIYKIYYGKTRFNILTNLDILKESEFIEIGLNNDFEVLIKDLKVERGYFCIPEEFSNISKIIDVNYDKDISNQFDTEYITIDNKKYKMFILGKDTLTLLDLKVYFSME